MVLPVFQVQVVPPAQFSGPVQEWVGPAPAVVSITLDAPTLRSGGYGSTLALEEKGPPSGPECETDDVTARNPFCDSALNPDRSMSSSGMLIEALGLRGHLAVPVDEGAHAIFD